MEVWGQTAENCERASPLRNIALELDAARVFKTIAVGSSVKRKVIHSLASGVPDCRKAYFPTGLFRVIVRNLKHPEKDLKWICLVSSASSFSPGTKPFRSARSPPQAASEPSMSPGSLRLGPKSARNRATAKQRAAARRNIKKAAQTAKRKRTIAHLPKKTRTADTVSTVMHRRRPRSPRSRRILVFP